MKDYFLLRSKSSGKYYRKVPSLGGVIASQDGVLDNPTSLLQLFFFETPEQAFNFLKTTGGGLPQDDTEVVPVTLTVKNVVPLYEAVFTVEESFTPTIELPIAPSSYRCNKCSREYSIMKLGEVCGAPIGHSHTSCDGVIK